MRLVSVPHSVRLIFGAVVIRRLSMSPRLLSSYLLSGQAYLPRVHFARGIFGLRLRLLVLDVLASVASSSRETYRQLWRLEVSSDVKMEVVVKFSGKTGKIARHFRVCFV